MAAFTAGLTAGGVPDDVAFRLKACLIDALGCAAAALHEEPVRMVRDGVLRLAGDGPATVLGAGRRSSADLAGFANGVAIRHLNWNDLYLTSTGGVKPSDAVGALLALAESEHASGRDLLRALAVAYETSCRLQEVNGLKARGWDGVTFLALSTACGASALLGLDEARTRQAIGIAGAAAAALLQTRTGELSMWARASGADAARKGVLGAVLAAGGLTGPEPIFEGTHGLARLVTGDIMWPADARWRTGGVHLRSHACLAATHAAVDAALALRRRGVRGADVERLEIHAFRFLLDGQTPDRLDPRNRETADHSVAYCVAAALLDGAIGPAQFTPERIAEREVRRLMSRVALREDAGFTAGWPDEVGSRVVAHLRTGNAETAEARLSPRGPQPVPDRGVIETKLIGVSPASAPLAARLWALEAEPDVAALPLAAIG